MDSLFLLLTLVFSIAIVAKISRWGDKEPPSDQPINDKPPSSEIVREITTPPPPVKASLAQQTKQPCAAQKGHAPPPPIPASKQINGRAYVIDGDTIRIGKIKIRLAGIDAPELDQPYGQKSKWAMVRICQGQRIRVELTGETSYDRLVGTCYLPDGCDIGAELIKQGLAIDGGHYSKGKYKHLEQPGMRARLIRYGHRRPRKSVSQ